MAINQNTTTSSFQSSRNGGSNSASTLRILLEELLRQSVNNGDANLISEVDYQKICELIVLLLVSDQIDATTKHEIRSLRSLADEITKQFRELIERKAFRDLVKDCLEKMYTADALSVKKLPSPFATIMLALMDPKQGVAWILSKNMIDEHIRKILTVFIDWLCKINFAPNLNIWIIQMVEGLMVSETGLALCNSTNHTTETFRSLDLSFPDDSDLSGAGDRSHSVQTLLDYFCSSEKLVGENQYFCDRCQQLRDCERSVTVAVPPQNLILTIKHFRYDQSRNLRAKLMNKILHNEDISITVVDAAGHCRQLHYRNYAVVVHYGTSMDSGHYYTYAQDGTGTWFKFNDSYVTECTTSELQNIPSPNTPYILFYQLVTDNAAVATETPASSAAGATISGPSYSVSSGGMNESFPALNELPIRLQEFVRDDNLLYHREVQEQRDKKASKMPLLSFGGNGGNRRQSDDYDDPPPSSCGSKKHYSYEIIMGKPSQVTVDQDSSSDRITARVGSRTKKAKVVFDPSDHHVPRKRNRRGENEMAVTGTPKSESNRTATPSSSSSTDVEEEEGEEESEDTRQVEKEEEEEYEEEDNKQQHDFAGFSETEVGSHGNVNTALTDERLAVPIKHEVSTDSDDGQVNEIHEHNSSNTAIKADQSDGTDGAESGKEIRYWTCDDVCRFFSRHCKAWGDIFQEQEIDGPSLLLIRRGDVLSRFGLKLGPAMELYQRIVALQNGDRDIVDVRLTWI
uniref:USP domain-containing protein n=1 Tax=Anopheles epiroticus TaxID=199890 RepID=A0A182PTI9_9DIPT